MRSFKSLILVPVLVLTVILTGCGLPAYSLVAEDYAPYVIQKNGVVSGMSTELVKAAMEAVNIKNDIVVNPWTTIYDKLQKSTNYLAFTCGRTEIREDMFIWIEQVGTYTGSIYSLKSNKTKINNLNDLKKFITGSVNQHYTAQYLLKKGFTEGVNIVSVDVDETNVKKLIEKKIDFLIANDLGISNIIKNNSKYANKLKKVYTINELTVPAYLVASKGTDQAIIDKFREGFKIIKTNGKYDEILSNYIGES